MKYERPESQRYRRPMVVLTLIMCAAIVGFIFGVVVMFSYADLEAIARFPHLTPNTRHLVWAVGLTMVGAVAVAIYATHSVFRWKGFALGCKDEMPRARVRNQWFSAPIDRVMVTPASLYLGGQRVPLRIGRKILFDDTALRHLILDRLPDGGLLK